MRKLFAILLLALVLVACGSNPVTKKASYQAPTDESGNYVTVELTLEDGKISEVTIDHYYAAQDAFKKALGADYGMVVASSIGKEWFEQAEALEQWMVGKTVEELSTADTEDLKTSCTMGIDEYVEAVKAAAEVAEEVK